MVRDSKQSLVTPLLEEAALKIVEPQPREAIRTDSDPPDIHVMCDSSFISGSEIRGEKILPYLSSWSSVSSTQGLSRGSSPLHTEPTHTFRFSLDYIVLPGVCHSPAPAQLEAQEVVQAGPEADGHAKC